MSKRISRFGVVVPDITKAVSFYEALGFNKDRELEIPMMKIAFVSLEGQILELIEKKEEIPFHKDGVLNHITFDVDNIEESIDEFKKAGTDFFIPPTPIGDGKFAFGYGPSGEVIELFEA